MYKSFVRPNIDFQPILVNRDADIVFPDHEAMASQTCLPEQSM